MLTCASRAQVKKANVESFSWNLCIQCLKNYKSYIFNIKFILIFLFNLLNLCSKGTS